MVLDVDLIVFEGVRWSYDKNTGDVWHGLFFFKYFHCEQMKEPALIINELITLEPFIDHPTPGNIVYLGLHQ